MTADRMARTRVLLTTFYPDADPERRAEFTECLRRNAAAFDEVHVLLEDAARPDLDDPKVSVVEFGRRATFGDHFAYANDCLVGQTVAVANADIYFDDGVARVHELDLDGTLLCLSRWDVWDDGSVHLLEHEMSQDVWIFDAPIRPFAADFPPGVWGCDNRLAWEAAHAGLALHNPARSLRAYHLHLSGVRRCPEDRRLHGNVLGVPADYLGPPRTRGIASAAFSEPMGYAVQTLEAGASSHVNEDRPFVAVPDALQGLAFTQVVANTEAAPVEVRFLAAGKLYVLACDDWWGFDVAREWLAEHGFYERLPRLETAKGGAFEAWSLVGKRGDRFVLPTQVMLAGRRLFG